MLTFKLSQPVWMLKHSIRSHLGFSRTTWRLSSQDGCRLDAQASNHLEGLASDHLFGGRVTRSEPQRRHALRPTRSEVDSQGCTGV